MRRPSYIHKVVRLRWLQRWLFLLHLAIGNFVFPGAGLQFVPASFECGTKKHLFQQRGHIANDGALFVPTFFYVAVRGNRQGNDWGPQYQAALFPHDESQKRSAERAIDWARNMLRRDVIGAGSGHHGTGTGAAGSVDGTGAAAPAWWEGLWGEVMTLVIPTKQKDFAPREKSSGERPP